MGRAVAQSRPMPMCGWPQISVQVWQYPRRRCRCRQDRAVQRSQFVLFLRRTVTTNLTTQKGAARQQTLVSIRLAISNFVSPAAPASRMFLLLRISCKGVQGSGMMSWTTSDIPPSLSSRCPHVRREGLAISPHPVSRFLPVPIQLHVEAAQRMWWPFHPSHHAS